MVLMYTLRKRWCGCMQVMRRIVDDTWQITYPPYISSTAKDLISKLLERRPARRIGAISLRLAYLHVNIVLPEYEIRALFSMFSGVPSGHGTLCRPLQCVGALVHASVELFVASATNW